MAKSELALVILAAGKGTRMKSSLHKVLHPLGGRPMLHHLLASAEPLNPTRKVIVVGAGKEQVEASVGTQAEIAVQEPQLGTGHAVQMTRDQLAGFKGDVLILYGDVPLLTTATMQKMIETRQKSGVAVVVLGFTPADAKAYGRLKLDADGHLDAIIEYKDASEDERAIKLCNSGIMALSGEHMFTLLDSLKNDNAAKEYYLTDVGEIANKMGLGCAVVEADEQEVMGINSRSELAEAEEVFQNELRQYFMDEGVSLKDPKTVYFSHDTLIGQDVTVEPNVVFGPGTKIAGNVTIKAFSHIEGAIIGAGSTVGPFVRLRPAAVLGEGVKVGNFVEIKKASVEDGAKVSHLSYIGDARIGKNANIGAGTITCNYDGYFKYHTDIGEGAFIGSNTALVAPVTIGDGAIVGAGSVITFAVEGDALAIARGKQKQLGGWAAKFRTDKKAKKMV
ncbi:MAG: bifunctional UDP-N-acetylglucosamine diphosphorylase/glucosamine-1-phosphate N-acetyltransferase GlmU [Emcibacteraceae bacterium]